MIRYLPRQDLIEWYALGCIVYLVRDSVTLPLWMHALNDELGVPARALHHEVRDVWERWRQAIHDQEVRDLLAALLEVRLS